MALPGTGIVNQGLQRIGINASIVGGGAGVGASQTVTRYTFTMGVDDNASNFAATDTAQNTRGALTNKAAQLLDALATRSSQTVTHVCTYATGTANFTIKGITLIDDSVANWNSGAGTDLVAGIAGQSITKTSSFSLAISVAITYTDNS